jgi:hypothetical protein
LMDSYVQLVKVNIHSFSHWKHLLISEVLKKSRYLNKSMPLEFRQRHFFPRLSRSSLSIIIIHPPDLIFSPSHILREY